jgi:radical SAM superfamily enzyme YgiQ (UPF0313 family)
MYRNKEYRVRTPDELAQEIRRVSAMGSSIQRVFLADGDALAAPQETLTTVLGEIRSALPGVHRVGIYGDSRSILKKGAEMLSELKDLGLGIVYFGVESGDEETLRAINKGATAKRQLEACHTVREAGLKLSVMVLLGLAGRDGGERHARATGAFLTQARPTYGAALTVTPVPGTELCDLWQSGRFELPDRWGMLEELAWMLESMEGYRGPFHANHASNYLPLKLRLPRDRSSAIALIHELLASRDDSRLMPDWARGL